VLDNNLHCSSSSFGSVGSTLFPSHDISRPLHFFPFESIQMQRFRSTSLAKTELGISTVLLFLIIVCSALSVWRLFRRFTKTEKSLGHLKAERYEDEDGIATEESETAYSYRLQRFLVLLLSLSAVGSLDSLALAIIATQSNPAIEQWLQFIAWVCVQPSRRIPVADINTALSYHPGRGAIC
jgi:hypothetical protein